MNSKKTHIFYAVLANTLTASLTNNFVWFAVTFWAYLQTKSVVVTSVMGGIYLGTVAFSGFFLGSIVDRYRKKTAMTISAVATLVLYIIAFSFIKHHQNQNLIILKVYGCGSLLL